MIGIATASTITPKTSRRRRVERARARPRTCARAGKPVIPGREAIRGTVPDELASFNTEEASFRARATMAPLWARMSPTVGGSADVAEKLPEKTLLAARGVGRRYGDHVA